MNRPPPLSAPPDDTLFEESLLKSRHFSPRQLRLLRKEMLILRAAIERAEVTQTGVELRRKLVPLGWLKWLSPAWAVGKSELGGLSAVMKQHPMLSSLISIAMSGTIRRTAAHLAKPAAKLGVVAFAGWSIWKVWQSVRGREFDEADSEDSADESDQHAASNE